jgi:tetratricopeptide (TPR) repeat protein
MRRWSWLVALAFVPSALAQAPQDPTAELLQKVEQAVTEGHVDAAIDLLQKASARPDAPGEIPLRLGRLLEGRLDTEAALAAFQSAAGKLDGAAKGEALAQVAVCQQLRGSKEAAASAQAAAAADPAGAWPKLALARVKARAGQGEAAVALAREAVAAGGAGGMAQAALGFALEATRDLPGAEAAYRAALATGDANALASIGLARVLRKTGRAAEAEPMLQKVIDAAPGAVEAYKEMARTKLALGRPEDAVSDAALAAAMGTGDADAQGLVLEVTEAKALELLKSGNVDQAVQELMALRDQHPDVAGVRIALAKALVKRRNVDEAIVELQKAIELDPTSAEAARELGDVQLRLKGNPTAAVAAYEKAVAADPKDLDAGAALGAALLETKQYDRAVEQLSRVTADAGYAKAEAWISLGGAQLALKRYKDAIASLDKGLAVTPDSGPGEAYLAWCYFGLKDATSFKVHGARARSLGFKEPTLLEYLRRVEAGEPIK